MYYQRNSGVKIAISLFVIFVLILIGIVIAFLVNNKQEKVDSIMLRLDTCGGIIEDPLDFNLNNYGYYEKQVEVRGIYGQLPTPSLEGSEFVGWSLDKNEPQIVQGGDYIFSTTDIMLYAIYNYIGLPTTYTIRYVDEQGVQIAKSQSISGIIGDTITLEPILIDGYHLNTDLTKLEHTIMPNSTFNLVYSPNVYYLNLISNGNEYTPIEYIYNSTLTLPLYTEIAAKDNKFNIIGYTFTNWTILDIKIDDGATITLDDMISYGLDINDNGASISLTAEYTINTYETNFHYYNGNQIITITENIAYSDHITVPSISFPSGYSFVGWFDTDTGATGTDISGKRPVDLSRLTMPANALDFYAGYNLLQYNINLNLAGGQYPNGKTNPTTYNVEDDFVLTNPEKTGQTFAGWVVTNDPDSLAQLNFRVHNITGDLNLTATYADQIYLISYNLNGGEFSSSAICPDTYTQFTENFTLSRPTRDGYIFTGWSGTDLQSITLDVTITKGSSGNREYTANWTPITYNINYELNGGILDTQHNSYTVEDMPYTLDKPTQNGYVFAGWKYNNGAAIVDFQFNPAEYLGDITFVATWTPQVYTITYDLKGGIQASEGSYPIHYDITESIQPTAPTRLGYDFAGWSLYNENDEPLQETSISIGSTGNRKFVANWTPRTDTKYTVFIYLMNENGEYSIEPDETKEYFGTTDTETTITPDVIDGYITPSNTKLTISANGESSIELRYIRSTYTVTVIGNGIESISTEPYYWGKTVTLNATLLNGYNFSDWTANIPDIQLNKSGTTVSFIMPKNNITITAVTTAIEYSINYNLDNGTAQNPTSYTVETPTFSLTAPTRTGYIFDGWTGTDITEMTTNVTITQGSIGDREYTAHWSSAPVAYTVNHYLQDLDLQNYSVTSITNYAQADTMVDAPLLDDYTGFTAPSIQHVQVNNDGSTVVNYYYTRNSYALTITRDDGILSFSGADTYLYGENITLVARVYQYYDFKGWQLDNEIVSTEENYSFIMGAQEYAFTATSIGQNFAINYQNVDSTAELTQNYTYSRVNPIEIATAEPERTGFNFLGWQLVGDADKTSKETVTLPAGTTGPITLNATWGQWDDNLFSYQLNADGTANIGRGLVSRDSLTVPEYIRLSGALSTNGVSHGADIVDKAFFDAGNENTYRVTSIRGGHLTDSGWEIPANAYTFLNSSVKTITLPASVTSIGVAAFARSSIEEINATGLTTISEYAFYECKFSTFSLPASVTTIKQGAFFNSQYLTNITLNEGLQIIEQGAFQKTAIKDISFPSTLTTLGRVTFYQLDTLQTVTFAANTQLNTIEQSAFGYCGNLTTVTFGENSVIGTIGQAAFYNNFNLTTVTFGANCTLDTIGQSAFSYCPNLQTINIPESIKIIDEYAFSDDMRLNSIGLTANSQLTTLGENAFQNCLSLYEIVIPTTCVSWGNSPFNQCRNLRIVYMSQNFSNMSQKEALFGVGEENENSVVEIGTDASNFSGTIEYLENGAVLWKKTAPATDDKDKVVLIGYIGNSPILDLREDTNGITQVGSNAFNSNLIIEEIYLPSSVIEFQAFAIMNAENLTTLVWEYDENNKNKHTVNTASFVDAHKLVKLGLPFNIDDLNFENDATMQFSSLGIEIINTSETTEFATTISTDGLFRTVTFGGNSALSGQTYLIDYIGVSNIVDLSSYTNIYAGLFAGDNKVSSVILNNTITAIPDAMFAGAYNLTSIEMPNTVTSIGKNAFRWNFNLTNANISDLTNLTEIGEYAFDMCLVLTGDIEIAGSVTVISMGAFRGCFNITSVTLNEGTTTIEAYAFQATGGITNETFTLPSTITSIHPEAFKDNENYTPPENLITQDTQSTTSSTNI